MFAGLGGCRRENVDPRFQSVNGEIIKPMIEKNSASMFLTDSDTCIVGCGTPLLFLTSVVLDKVFLICSSCEGIWDSESFFFESPRLVPPSHFLDCSLVPSTMQEISKIWHGDVLEVQSVDHEWYYCRFLQDMLKQKLLRPYQDRPVFE